MEMIPNLIGSHAYTNLKAGSPAGSVSLSITCLGRATKSRDLDLLLSIPHRDLIPNRWPSPGDFPRQLIQRAQPVSNHPRSFSRSCMSVQTKNIHCPRQNQATEIINCKHCLKKIKIGGKRSGALISSQKTYSAGIMDSVSLSLTPLPPVRPPLAICFLSLSRFL